MSSYLWLALGGLGAGIGALAAEVKHVDKEKKLAWWWLGFSLGSSVGLVSEHVIDELRKPAGATSGLGMTMAYRPPMPPIVNPCWPPPVLRPELAPIHCGPRWEGNYGRGGGRW